MVFTSSSRIAPTSYSKWSNAKVFNDDGKKGEIQNAPRICQKGRIYFWRVL